jgi:hypothetical protein
MGFAMANQMVGAMGQGQNQGQQTPPPVPPVLAFHLVINGQQAGPFDMNTLAGMLSQNQLTKETLVWRQGMSGWIAAGQVPELTHLFAATPPPIPPTI